MPEAWRDSLANFGHELKVLKYGGVTQAIAWDHEAKHFIGVHDPRVPGRFTKSMVAQFFYSIICYHRFTDF